jgi:probable DNA metabolism protein
MNRSLIGLFTMIDAPSGIPPLAERPCTAGELCFDSEEVPPKAAENVQITEDGQVAESELADAALVAGLYSSDGIDVSALPKPARFLYELSINAFDALIHAWMSGLPIEAEMIRFGRKILNAADRAGAEKAALDRGDPDVRTVLGTAQKVWHEIDRFRGFLRFIPDEEGVYIAHCEPDYYILPALAEHFALRFGPTSWAIIDRKRGLCLRRISGGPPELCKADNISTAPASDEWEQLWRHYHKAINNESRNKPELQRQFMPKRYWKNLPEMK